MHIGCEGRNGPIHAKVNYEAEEGVFRVRIDSHGDHAMWAEMKFSLHDLLDTVPLVPGMRMDVIMKAMDMDTKRAEVSFFEATKEAETACMKSEMLL